MERDSQGWRECEEGEKRYNIEKIKKERRSETRKFEGDRGTQGEGRARSRETRYKIRGKLGW